MAPYRWEDFQLANAFPHVLYFDLRILWSCEHSQLLLTMCTKEMSRVKAYESTSQSCTAGPKLWP